MELEKIARQLDREIERCYDTRPSCKGEVVDRAVYAQLVLARCEVEKLMRGNEIAEKLDTIIELIDQTQYDGVVSVRIKD